MDDIVKRPRWMAEEGGYNDNITDLAQSCADEIEWLRAALALAVGELSTYGPMRYTSPEQLMEHFMQEACRG